MNAVTTRKTKISLHTKFRGWINTPITLGTLVEWELYLMIISSFLHSFGLPTVTSDILCFINLLLLVFALPRAARVFSRYPIVVCEGIILLLYSIWTALFNGVSPLNSIWSFVTFSRPFVYGFLALAYWDTERFDAVFHRLVRLQ